MRKDVRVWFSKTGTARYISHLDLNRCMSRAFHKAKLPLWYTEGFNPHVFLTFAAPLSLGFEGRHESMDIRLIEDMPYPELIEKLNAGLPHDIDLGIGFDDDHSRPRAFSIAAVVASMVGWLSTLTSLPRWA